MPTALKNILIGIFVIAAIGVITFILLFLHPSVGDNGKTLRVRFTDIDKVNIGTRVTFAGHPVGEVVSIHQLPQVRTGRKAKNGQIYVYELVLQVDSGIDVFNSDSIVLKTSGLLGERFIEINPLPLKPGETLKNVENELLYAELTATVEDTMKQFSELSKKIDLILDDFHGMIEDIKQEKIISNISTSVRNVLDITNSLNQPEKYRETLDNILTVTRRANNSWSTVDNTLEKFHVTSNNSVAFTNKANQIIEHIQAGKGNLGKLIMGDELYLRLTSIFHRGETIMNDIGSYGMLFHMNKRWQREQARRLDLATKLSNSDEFTRYFNGELNGISSSLAQVSMILSESDCSSQPLIYNPLFKNGFSELLKGVENMEESLKMYNEQIIDQEGA